jgi:hypothetical protein
MPSGRRGSSRKRGTSLSVIWCYHNYPTLVTPTEMGRYHARCLACLTVGPERPSSEAARKALQILGTVDFGSEQRTASARA